VALSPQAELHAARSALSAWQDAFRDDPCCAGTTPSAYAARRGAVSPVVCPPHTLRCVTRRAALPAAAPATVLDALLALRGGERDAREGGREAARRAAALAARADAADAEASELRSLLATAAGPASAPAAREVAKLMLDPAAARELTRLTSALDAARECLKQKDEEIAALGFSKDSKSGRMLMARVRMLIKENDDFGEQVSEGRLHTLETEIVLLREQVSSLKRAYSELEDSARALNAENEELQLRAFGVPEAAAAGGGGGDAVGAAAAEEADAADAAEAEPEAAAAPAAGGRGAKRPRRGGKAADEGA
jgi:hypothetical protein